MNQYIDCASNRKPEKAGFYEVYIENVRPNLPIYLEFNGENWVGLEQLKKENESTGVYWSEGDEPLEKEPVYLNPFTKV